MKVIAIHGDFATGEQLRYDMGDPPWVDHYATAKTFSQFVAQVPYGDVVLVGYSRGAEWIRQFANAYGFGAITRIRGMVGYEPLALGEFVLARSVPRLLIYNSRGRGAWTRLGASSIEKWRGPGTTELAGRGFHIRVKMQPPFIGHAWDKSINPEIQRWLSELGRK